MAIGQHDELKMNCKHLCMHQRFVKNLDSHELMKHSVNSKSGYLGEKVA